MLHYRQRGTGTDDQRGRPHAIAAARFPWFPTLPPSPKETHTPMHRHTSIPIRSLSVLESPIVWRLFLSHLFPLFHLGFLDSLFHLVSARFTLISLGFSWFSLIPFDFPCFPLFSLVWRCTLPQNPQQSPTSQHKTRDLPPDCSTWNARLV